jgi:predicted dehydrogenase
VGQGSGVGLSGRGQGRGVGLVGCGRWGRHVLRDLLALGARVAVADPDAAARAAAERAGAHALPDAASLPALDGYVVATPATTHAAVAGALVARGRPVFVEKPLATDPAEARRLAAAAPERLFVMDKWRYHAGVRALAALARGGELGEVHGLETVREQCGHAHADADALWTLAPHDLSIALEVLGAVPEPRAAVAAGEPPEHWVALLGTAPWLALRVSVRAPRRRRAVRLHGERGVALLEDGDPPRLVVTRSGAPGEARPVEGEAPLRAELRAFLDHLDGGPPPKSAAAEGARAVEVVARLRVLAGAGRP